MRISTVKELIGELQKAIKEGRCSPDTPILVRVGDELAGGHTIEAVELDFTCDPMLDRMIVFAV